MKEIEIKFRLRNLEEIRKRLRRLGGKRKETVFERNWVFDFPDQNLWKNGKLLRLREETGNSKNVYLTFKNRLKDSRFKVMEEIEIRVSDFAKTSKLLEALGLRKVWEYQKKRENWELWKQKITLDTLPVIGEWMEIEGDEKGIEKIAKELGFEISQGTNKSYRELLEEKGKIEDLVF